jgi:DNA-binding NarL/FixJ family response regulator
MKNPEAVLSEKRQKLWTCLTKGMKGYEIAKELNIGHSTKSRDIKYLTAQSELSK